MPVPLRVTMRVVDKFSDLRLKHVSMCTDVLKVIGLEHLVDDVYDAVRERRDDVNFNPERIE